MPSVVIRRKPPRFQYRLIWRREGSQQATRIFNSPSSLFWFVQRMVGERPWVGASKRQLCRVWAILATRLDVPIQTLLDKPVRQVMRDIQASQKRLLFMRVEVRQVGVWTELVQPLEALIPPSYTKRCVKAEQDCDDIDAHPDCRWTPDPTSIRYNKNWVHTPNVRHTR